MAVASTPCVSRAIGESSRGLVGDGVWREERLLMICDEWTAASVRRDRASHQEGALGGRRERQLWA